MPNFRPLCSLPSGEEENACDAIKKVGVGSGRETVGEESMSHTQNLDPMFY